VSTTAPILQDPPAASTHARSGRRHPGWVWIVAVTIVVTLLLGGYTAIEQGAKGYFAFAPGTAPRLTASPLCKANSAGGDPALPDGAPCVRISVPTSLSHNIQGSLYMVDVLVGRATPAQYVLSKLGLLHTFSQGTQLIPARDVLGSTPPGQLSCQDNQQMEGATSSASVVALRHLGYQVKENDLGAQLYQVAPGSPAATSGLQCNDIVVAINSKPVHTASDLGAAIRAGAPGQNVRVTVQREGPGGKLQTKTLTARLGPTPASVAPGRAGQPFLGVVSSTRSTYTFPFDVTIDVGNIGGPSAGLALTLATLDILSNGDLTGGHRVAATGTIGLDGTVGDVGGVAQKAVAVRRAGAQVFLVPADELKDAQSQAGSMKVYPVKNLQQALDILKGLGGHVPAPTTSSV
jgi:PDZ domain-containing protein